MKRQRGGAYLVQRVVRPFKLYVWKGFCPDYTSGLAVALAQDEADARNQVEKAYGSTVYVWGTLSVYPVTRRFVAYVSGGG
jgi:hypothetical protein